MTAASDPVVIVSAARTPLGRFMGELSPFSAHQLGSHVIGAAVERAKLSPERIDEVFMGCVLPAGQGQAPARQAARGAKLPDATGATTVNKVCGSGMKATMLAHDIINAGSAEIVLSGGMESMTNAPYLLAKARGGYRAGHDRIIDHMFMDGLKNKTSALPIVCSTVILRLSRIPSSEDPSRYGGYANSLINTYSVNTIYVYPDVAVKSLMDYLGTTGVNLIGLSTPNPVPGDWVMTIRQDEIKAIQNAWPDLIAGKGGENVPAPLGIWDVNSANLSAGKQRLVQQTLDELTAGQIATGVGQ